ncbi:MAG: DUF2851 family protein [Candidatus Brocadiia bacterium]
MPAGKSPAYGFSDLYSRLQERFAAQVEEETPAYGEAGQNVREEIVRCIWFGSHFPPDELTTDDGRRIEVISPGWWNVEGGPDFVRAEFILEGAGRMVGDVEVHTVASDWYRHGHHRQPEYNDVALHVVLWEDRKDTAAGGVQTEGGDRLPQLTLSTVIEEDLEELVEVMGPEEEPPPARPPEAADRFCGRALREGLISAEWLGRLLDAAGDHRILSRANVLADLFQNHSREQLLYERIAEALGFKNNRMPFMQLAGLLSVRKLREIVPADAEPPTRSRMLEAALLVVGGFLNAADAQEDDEETARYREELRQAWRRLGEPPTQVRLSPDHWEYAGTRPVNYPARRIAALARLLAGHLHEGLFACFLRLVNTARPEGRGRTDVAVRRALLEAFTELEHPYWSHRYKLGGARLKKPRALVGRQRARSILVDVLLPMLLAHARLEDGQELAERLYALWSGMPRRSANAVTRRMTHTLFGERDGARDVVNSTRRQQGLHQIYRDCCRGSNGCEQCIIYLAHRSELPSPDG